MNKKRIGPLRRMAKKEVQKEIKKQEKIEKRNLDVEEKRDIKNKVFKKLRTRATIFGSVGLLGIGGILGYGFGSNSQEIKGITDGKRIEIDAGEIEKDINIATEEQNQESARDIFINGIKIDVSQDSNITQQGQNELKENTMQEIDVLKTPDEVLEYTKKIYVEQYNKNNDEKISVEDVRLEKQQSDIVFYKDTAENGDEILRYCSEHEARETGKGIDGEYPKIKVLIKNENISIIEEVAQKPNGEIVNIYSESKEVKEDKHTILQEVGQVVLTGIDRSISMNKEGTSLERKLEYKNRFINAVTKYKENQVNEIINGNTEKDNEYEH